MSAQSTQGLVRALHELRAELRRFLIARTGSEVDADDLLSDLWIKVNAARPGPVANANSYLFRMANNLVLDRLREARRRERREIDWVAERHGRNAPFSDVADTSANAEELLARESELKILADAVARLPAGAQRVLRMHKLDGLSHAEVAKRLGISKSAVEKHMAVAMTHLRRSLTPEAPVLPRRLANGGGPSKPEPGVEP